MKIAVTSTGPTIEHYVGRRATHCGYLLIIDPDTMRYEAVRNPIVALRGPAAGKLFAQVLLESGAHIVLMGGYRSEVLKALGDAGIRILTGMSGSVRSVVEQFKHSYCSVLS